MTLQERWLKQPQSSDTLLFDTLLSNKHILEIGRIDTMLKGKAIVKLFDKAATKIECELLSLGNDMGTLQPAIPGQYVLVFFLNNHVSVKDKTVDVGKPHFSCAKCIPIGIQGQGNVQLSANGDAVTICGESYSCIFGQDTIQINDEDSSIIISPKTNKVCVVQGNTSVNVSDETVDVIVGGEYQDGELQDCKVHFTLDSDGVTVESEKLTFDGDVSVTGDMEVTGKVTAKDELEVTGKVTAKDELEVSSDVTINGDTTMSGSLDVMNGGFTVE